MSLNFIILSVRPLDSDEQQLNEQLIEVSEIDYHIVNNLAGNVSLMQIVKCDKEEIKKELTLLSTQYSDNVILLAGDASDVVYDTIMEVIDNNNDLCDINISISNLIGRLKYLIARPICGIRNRNLIINLCGSCTIECLKEYGYMILDILCLINKSDKKIYDTKKDDSCVEPFNNNINNNNNNSDEPFHNSNNNDGNSDKPFRNNCADDNLAGPSKNYSDDNFDESFYNNNSNDNSVGSSKNTNNIHNSDEMSMDISFEEQSKTALTINDIIYKEQKGSKMVSLEEAKNIMENVIIQYYERCTETVQTNDAYGRIVAENVHSSVNVPPCCISAKRGYAVLASDGQCVRKVLKANLTLAKKKILVTPGTCVRVRSGDPIPDGATAVVMSANTKIIDERDNDDYFNMDNEEYEIEVLVAPKEDENIRNTGCEIQFNENIKNSRSRVETADLGILTLCNIDSITVFKLPTVGLLFIGYELLDPENISTVGHIFGCNRIIVSSLLKKNGYNLMEFGISAHEPNIIQYRIKDALDKVDLLVIIGRANDKDILKPTLKTFFNANIHFGCVNIKPGKSTMFASCEFKQKRKFFLCMSANPTTVPIITHILLLPLLNMCCNLDDNPLKIQARIKTSHELHLRPRFSWTSLQWSEKEADTYPSAYCIDVKHQHMMKYQFSNALLMLPRYTSEVPKLNANSVFLPAMFMGN